MESLLVHMSSVFSDENWSPEGASHLDLTYLEGTTCYCDHESEIIIEKSFKPFPVNILHWIDGGDYHYLTELWMRKLKAPAKLFLIDNHPDDQEPSFGGDILSCGSWVSHLKRTNPLIQEDAGRIYISIDLDWLSPDFARTNWNQGDGTLDELLDILRKAVSGKPVAGVDICGGITSAQGGKAEDFAINRRTRDALQAFFAGIRAD